MYDCKKKIMTLVCAMNELNNSIHLILYNFHKIRFVNKNAKYIAFTT